MRPSKHEYFMDIASVVSSRATCCRRAVGCVLVNKKGHIIGTGYNGPARGLPHCEGDNKCQGADLPSGQGLSVCEAIHAEQNALLQCPDVEDIYWVYVTTKPCEHCVKMLMNTGAKTIIFGEDYPNETKSLWERCPERKMVRLNEALQD